MNSAYTISTDKEPTILFADTASGPWSPGGATELRPARKSHQGLLRPIGMSLAFALSPLTSVADPWIVERRRQSQPTAFMLIESIGRRRITRAEALRLTMEILERAERERLWSADWEAARGADWGGVQ
ncbi:MAG: hypothetical protein AMXMBFR20_19450 [Planctomycetia bacterium]